MPFRMFAPTYLPPPKKAQRKWEVVDYKINFRQYPDPKEINRAPGVTLRMSENKPYSQTRYRESLHCRKQKACVSLLKKRTINKQEVINCL